MSNEDIKKKLQDMNVGNLITDISIKGKNIVSKLNDLRHEIEKSNEISQKKLLQDFYSPKNITPQNEQKRICGVNDLIVELLNYDKNTIIECTYKIINPPITDEKCPPSCEYHKEDSEGFVCGSEDALCPHEEQKREIINTINKYQQRTDCHPLTCGNDSRHSLLIPVEKNGSIILKCPDCDYEQSYIPSFLGEIK